MKKAMVKCKNKDCQREFEIRYLTGPIKANCPKCQSEFKYSVDELNIKEKNESKVDLQNNASKGNSQNELLEEFKGLINQVSVDVINSGVMKELEDTEKNLKRSAAEVSEEIIKLKDNTSEIANVFETHISNATDSFDESMEESQKKLSTLNKNIDDLEIIVEKFDEIKVEYVKRIDRINQLIEEVDEDLNKVDKSLNGVDNDLNQMKNKFSSLHTDITNSLNDNLDDVKSELDIFTDEINDSLRANIKTTDKQLANFQTKVKKTKENFKTMLDEESKRIKFTKVMTIFNTLGIVAILYLMLKG